MVFRVLKSVLLRLPVMVSEVTVLVFMPAEVRAAESVPAVATLTVAACTLPFCSTARQNNNNSRNLFIC
jgi:hypothetical protein